MAKTAFWYAVAVTTTTCQQNQTSIIKQHFNFTAMDNMYYSGECISEPDKAFAKDFENFVNGRMASADRTGRELTKAHCYLQ